MTIDNINRSLQERFAQPLKDCYDRRIIFWYDSEREFESMLDELNLPDVKILRLTGNNFFEAKMLLCETDTTSNYLVYDPLTYKKREDNWLRDVQLYSEEFRADLISIQMDELHIPQTVPLRRTVKLYQSFFANKERTAKLAALNTHYETAAQLHIDIMAVLSSAESNTVQGLICALLCDSPDEEENNALQNIIKFGNLNVLKDMLAKYTGYYAEDINLSDLTAHLILSALSVGLPADVLAGMDKYISVDRQTFCYDVIDEWAFSEQRSKLMSIAEEVEQRFRLSERLQKQEITALMEVDCLPCVDECIIAHYMNEISENVVKSSDILEVVEKRRTGKWYHTFAVYYDGLYALAQMHTFYLDHIAGFHYGTAEQLWKAYCEELYQMDSYYRAFHIAFRKSMKSALSDLDDLFKNVADAAERLYKNWFLTELNSQWCSLIRSDMENSGLCPALPQQADFYSREIMPFIRNKNRVFVIVSDAFRYETAIELNKKLLRETNGTATISSMQSVFPSLTKYGMAALLPHDELQLTEGQHILCDGMNTDGTENRCQILKKSCPDNVAVAYESLLSMKTAQRRELISGSEVVYIYHNKVDAVGDKSLTEHHVFDACTEAVEELTGLVKLIVNSMNGTNILITADHGFLYSYKTLEESDKAERSIVSGEILELHRRCIIAQQDATSDYLMRIPMLNFNSKFTGFAPLEAIRMKTNGGGEHFVHGGISLQECCVPVITFRNIKAGSKQFVDIRKVPITLLSRTRKIANNIFSLEFYQQEAVSGKVVPATYELYFCDEQGDSVSDVQKLIADKTTDNVQERVFRVRFTLKGREFNGSEPYYLNITDKETGELKEHIEFSIKIAFANDFGF